MIKMEVSIEHDFARITWIPCDVFSDLQNCIVMFLFTKICDVALTFQKNKRLSFLSMVQSVVERLNISEHTVIIIKRYIHIYP